MTFGADDPNGEAVLRFSGACLIISGAELIVPAVHGTLGVLKSVLKHACVLHKLPSQLSLTWIFSRPSVKRVVLLSSVAAVKGSSDVGSIDESHWNEEAVANVQQHGRNANHPDKYRASKCLSEKGMQILVFTRQSC